MQVEIAGTTSIFDLVKKHPEIKEIMVQLGFSDIVKPGMLQSVGRVMTLEKGSRMKNIDWTIIENTFSTHGFVLKKGKTL